MARPRSITFIIPVRNDCARLRRCLESIGANRLEQGTMDVIVADNGSTDGSAEAAREAGAHVLDLPGKPVAALRNEAVGLARGEILAFVDADHEIAADWCQAAVDALGDDETIGAAGAPCHPPRHANWVQAAYDRFRSRPSGRIDIEWLGAGNMAMRTAVFRQVGGFDTRLETCEDVDLCNRVRQAGYRIRHEPAMFNIHFGDPSSLKAVFMGELWRGRDNIRVTLRGPLSLRALPSLVIPVANLVLLLAGVSMTLVTARVVWLMVPLLSFTAAVLLRTIRMGQNGAALSSASVKAPLDRVREWVENAMVAAVYEAARAVALVVRVSHGIRRSDAPTARHEARVDGRHG